MSTGSLQLILEYELLFRHLRHLTCDSCLTAADDSDGLLSTVGLTCGLLYDWLRTSTAAELGTAVLSMYVSCSSLTSVVDCAWMGSSPLSFEMAVRTEGFTPQILLMMGCAAMRKVAAVPHGCV